MKVTTRMRVVIACGIAIAVGVVVSMRVFQAGPEWDKLAQQGIFQAKPAETIQPFTLVNQDGQVFTEQQFRGKWSFVFVGYTFCPDVCPTTLSVLKSVRALLEQSGNADNTAFVMITADPERDTSERLKAYLSFFHPDFIGLTGDVEVIRPLAKTIKAGFKIPDHAPGESYFVNHSSHISLIDPSGNSAAFFQMPHDAKQIAEAFSAIKK